MTNEETETCPNKKAIVLLSGGLDSLTCLAMTLQAKYEVIAISFNYSQRHKIELNAADSIADYYGIKHITVGVDLSYISTSALTTPSISVPEREPIEDDIPETWVPQRNSIFLSHAFALAEVAGADIVVIGANQIDYSGYPDCREEYLHAMWNALNAGSKKVVEGGEPIRLVVPLLKKSKKEIAEIATKINAPIHLSYSCYNGGEKACGVCETCCIRLAAFKELGEADPITYEKIPFKYLQPGCGFTDPYRNEKYNVVRVSQENVVIEGEDGTPISYTPEEYKEVF